MRPFTYDCKIKYLGVMIPFTNFDCVVLSEVNMVAFVPIVGLLFGILRSFLWVWEWSRHWMFFYCAEGVDKGTQVSLRGQANRVYSFLLVFLKSCQCELFQVRVLEGYSKVIYNDSVNHLFPLYQEGCPAPIKECDPNSVTKFNLFSVSFLKKFLKMHMKDIFEKYDDDVDFISYLCKRLQLFVFLWLLIYFSRVFIFTTGI